jgi:hypothetical protein
MLLCKLHHDAAGEGTFETCCGMPTYGPCAECGKVTFCADCIHLHSAGICTVRDGLISGRMSAEEAHERMFAALHELTDAQLHRAIDTILSESPGSSGVLLQALSEVTHRELPTEDPRWGLVTGLEGLPAEVRPDMEKRLEEQRERYSKPEFDPSKCEHKDMKYRTDGWGWCPNCFTMKKQGKTFKYQAVIPPEVWSDLLRAVQETEDFTLLEGFYAMVEKLCEKGPVEAK